MLLGLRRLLVNRSRFRWQAAQALGLAVLTAVVLTACTSAPDAPPADTAPAEIPAEISEESAAPAAAEIPRLEGTATVELAVNGGTVTIELDGEHAPVTAGNFVDLVERGIYDGTVFHRVVRDPEPFVVQGGDPQSKEPGFPPELLGTGGYVDPDTDTERNVPLEITPAGEDEPVYGQTFRMAGIQAVPELRHTRGAVAMARSQDPNSASSQFYITLEDKAFLDGEYAVFGYVTDGMDVVDGIEQGDTLTSVTVVSGADNLQGGPTEPAEDSAAE